MDIASAGRGLALWHRVWPAALGVLVAVASVFGVGDGRDLAPVVAASGLVYLAAAATASSLVAWPAFGVTLVLITLDKFTTLDATPWILALACGMLLVGLIAGRTRPWWSLPLQTIAMLVLGAIAIVAIRLDPTFGGLLVAGALLGHAGWDILHYRARRVVDRRLAGFCAVLDVVVAGFLIILALAV